MTAKNDSHIPNPKGSSEESTSPIRMHKHLAMGQKETGGKDPNAGVKTTGPCIGNAPKNY